MKIKIQTLTGQTSEIEVKDEGTVRDVKREIYKSGKITGAVRIVKGQDVLPDDSTLVQHNITDGTTVNIVIEPDKQINVNVKLNSKTLSHAVSHSITVNELKQLLIEHNQVVFLIEEFSLALTSEVGQDAELSDVTLPLHHYDVRDDTTLNVVKPFIMLNVVNRSKTSYLKGFSKNITVSRMKQIIKSAPSLFSNIADVLDIVLFLKTENGYKKLSDKSNVPISKILSDGDSVYFIEDKFYHSQNQMSVYHNGHEVGRVGGEKGEVIMSVKLRAQNQFGFPVSCFHITYGNSVYGNDQLPRPGGSSVSSFRMNIL